MLNRSSKWRSCGCCPVWRIPGGRAYEKRQWQAEDWDEEYTEAEYRALTRLAIERVNSE
ncbi:hypothetical protein PBI_MINILON_3 [Mycobacterium phage MiniLon]|nr:hypothetical protein PBI_MINILON_3 [Mycobacterium phage MiniLon]